MLNGSKMTEDEQPRCVWSEEREAAPKEIVLKSVKILKSPKKLKRKLKKGGGSRRRGGKSNNCGKKVVR